MGKNLEPQFPFRCDKETILKLDYIANQNTRKRNDQIKHLIKQCITEYESDHGELTIDEDGIIHPNLKKEKSSKSKIG